MKYLLTYVLCIGFTLVHGQQIAIQTDCANSGLIYNCYYNKMKIVIEGMSCSDFIVKSDSFDVKKIENCFYFIRPIGMHKMPIPIEIHNAKTGKLIKTAYMEFVDSIPLPELRVNKPRGREYGYVISPSTDSIYCVAPFSDRYNQALKFSILSYEIDVVSREKTVYTQKVNGCKISEETKKCMEKMYANDYFVLREIRVRDQNGNNYLIPQKVLPVHY